MQQQQQDWPKLIKQYSFGSCGKTQQPQTCLEAENHFNSPSILAVSADETQVFQLTQPIAINLDSSRTEPSHFGPKHRQEIDSTQLNQERPHLPDLKLQDNINIRDNDFSFINSSPIQGSLNNLGNHSQDSQSISMNDFRQCSIRFSESFNQEVLSTQNHKKDLILSNEKLKKCESQFRQLNEQFTMANSLDESPIHEEKQTPTLCYDSVEEQENQILIEPARIQLQIERYDERSLNSKIEVLLDMTKSLRGWLQELELIKSPDELIKRTLIAFSQVLKMEIKDWQCDAQIFFRYCKKNTVKFASATFILSLTDDNFKLVNNLMEEPDFKADLQSTSQVSFCILEFALLLQETFEKYKLVQASREEEALIQQQNSYLPTDNIQINPVMMELENFQSSPKIQGEQHNFQRQNSTEEFYFNIPQIQIGQVIMNDNDFLDLQFATGSFMTELNEIGQNIQFKNEISHLDLDEIAVQLYHIDEKANQLKKKPEMQKMTVNRKMEVNELNLRGLSSEKNSQQSSQKRKKQSRFRKPFNSFKEDIITKKTSQNSHENDYDRIGLQAFHSLHPFFKSKLELNQKPQRKKRRNRSNKSPANWQTVNTGQMERIDECYPGLHSNKSQANAISVFKNHEAMTDMQQRYLTFNSYIQAQNRIEMLARENLHLQKLLITCQHDLRLLQRFTKKYFKSMEFFKQKEFFCGDEETQKVLMNCFQEKPVVLLAFASPLVRKIEKVATQKIDVSEMPLLDFSKEFAGAVNGIQQTKNAIKIAYVQATVEKLFQFCINENPVGMHFSGHGVSNEVSMQGANCLVMETEDGCAHYLTEDQITKFIQDLNTPLKFVFLASCHSEFAGILFHIAGVEHVICVKHNEEIYDKAAIILAKHFYNFLFSERNTVCKAFERAKLFLSSNSDPKLSREANKFIMIKDSDDISD